MEAEVVAFPNLLKENSPLKITKLTHGFVTSEKIHDRELAFRVSAQDLVAQDFARGAVDHRLKDQLHGVVAERQFFFAETHYRYRQKSCCEKDAKDAFKAGRQIGLWTFY